MPYLNLAATLDSNSASNSEIIASSPDLSPLLIDSLLLIVDLRSSPRNSFQRSVQLKFREKGSSAWELIAEESLANKSSVYRENLLKYLTLNPTFRLSPDYELAISLVGTPLSAPDTVRVLGSAYRPGPGDAGDGIDGSSSAVTQNFITAVYSVPPRDDWQYAGTASGWQFVQNLLPLRFFKDQAGLVHLEGWVQKTTADTNTNIITVLPTTYGLGGYAEFLCMQQGVGAVAVALSGDRLVFNGSNQGAICLTGISFLGV